MSKFKSYKQTCALIREAKKEQHRVTEFLVLQTPIKTARLSEFDATGTLSHLLLLYLARLEEASKAFPRFDSKPPTLPETVAERKTAFCEERRKSSQRQIQDRSSRERTKTTTLLHSGGREGSKTSDSLVMDVAHISDRSITRSVSRREVKHSNPKNHRSYSRGNEMIMGSLEGEGEDDRIHTRQHIRDDKLPSTSHIQNDRRGTI